MQAVTEHIHLRLCILKAVRHKIQWLVCCDGIRGVCCFCRIEAFQYRLLKVRNATHLLASVR